MIARFTILLCLCAMLVDSVGAYYGIYYGTDQKMANATYGFNIMIIEPYNFNLYKNYTGKKICYISVGEFDGTSDELWSLWLHTAVIWYNVEWKGYKMDVANPLWQRYLLGQEAQRKALGCHGLFLDTIWQEGQEIAVTNTIANFRKNWGNGYFIANNAHLIKTLIRDSVDGFLFEDFFTKGSTADHRLWYTKQMQEYQSIQKQYGKSLYAISYGNPFISPKWGNEVLKNALDYRFEVIFADANLTNIYGHVDFSAKKIVK